MSKSIASRKKHRPSALGLAQFADAKQSTYDKQARKLKEMNLNSKVVNKYRKLKARLADGSAAGQGVRSRPSGQLQEPVQASVEQPRKDDSATGPTASPSETSKEISERGGDSGRKAKFKKPAHQNQRIHAEKEKERAMEQRSRQEAQREAAERVSRRADAFKKRKQHSTQMRKKTRSGQPVMKVRIGKMLEQLQDEAC